MNTTSTIFDIKTLTNGDTVCCRVDDISELIDFNSIKQNPRRQARFFSHVHPLRLIWLPLALFFMLCALFVSSLPAQQRLVPPAPAGKPELSDSMRDAWKKESTPFRQEWTRNSDYKKVVATIVRTRGWTHTMRTDDGKIFPLDDRALLPVQRFWSERLVIRGKVEPFAPQTSENSAILQKAGLRSLIYTRPDLPKEATGADPQLRQLRFLLYTPAEAWKNGASFPLIIYLHGTNARGTDNFKNYSLGGRTFQYFIDHDWQKIMPCYVLIPQSDVKNDWWFSGSADNPSKPTLLTGQVIDVLKATRETAIDLSRLLVTGYSGGGFGCYEFLRVFPGKFAAVVPIAAYNDICISFNHANVAPVWQFIHEKDPSLYWRDIRWEIAVWKNLNVEHRMTIVEGSAAHISWSNPKQAEEFRRWLQSQKLKKVTYPSDPGEVAKE